MSYETVSDVIAERDALRAENESLRHDLDRVVQRETDLLNENEALQAALAEWQRRAEGGE